MPVAIDVPERVNAAACFLDRHIRYWSRHERTKATMPGEWLRTGDMFDQDSDGYFYFCGRADDMLKVGGMWGSPAELRRA